MSLAPSLFSTFTSHSYQWGYVFYPPFLTIKPVILGLHYFFNSEYKSKTEENNEKLDRQVLLIKLSHLYANPEKEEALVLNYLVSI